MKAASRDVFVAVDTGGTFTDLVMYDPGAREVRYTKALTTHKDPIDGILDCTRKAEVALDRAALFKHGTTHVINTLLERSGRPIALVTTRGFGDIIEFGRGNRTEPFNLFYRREPPLVAREHRFEIDERIDGQGKVLRAPQRVEVEEVAEKLKRLPIAAVAVSFINSYLEASHEEEVTAWLRELLPDLFVTNGVELTREWYEYERTSTAAANAYAGPTVGRYVAALDQALGKRSFGGRLLMMGSNGGILSAQHAAGAPILLVESGPVGGCIGAGAFGNELGFNNLIAFDMGGTTAKCAVVKNGEFAVESLYYAGGYGRGIPIRAPVIDMVEVGAGGGSIAYVDGQNRLNVGPRSAGSMPGPVAYGRGGKEITVTDANLLLGRLNPDRFQGGEMRLDSEGARRALADGLGKSLGYHGEQRLLQLACGVLAIAAVKMGDAIKRITVERALDPRDFVLFSYGGGGPLHSADLARELAIPLVLIPPEPGNFSAIGMLLADIRRDEGRTYLKPLTGETLRGADALFAGMEAAMKTSITADFGKVPIRFERTAEMRFRGQYHTVRVPVTTEDADEVRQTFHQIYRQRYGHAMEKSPAEFVSVHCTAMAQTPKPSIAALAGELASTAPRDVPTRPVFFPAHGGAVATKVFTRRSLPIGFKADGPAVIEEYGSTTLVSPADRFEIGPLGEIRIHIDQIAKA
ncbi:MAG: hydantoinase/oxoprolinase family protein [Burkholderiales bacterium]